MKFVKTLFVQEKLQSRKQFRKGTYAYKLEKAGQAQYIRPCLNDLLPKLKDVQNVWKQPKASLALGLQGELCQLQESVQRILFFIPVQNR